MNETDGKAGQSAPKILTPAAQRALAEAEQRRELALQNQKTPPKEIGGRKESLDPARYGDWERGGLICDF